MGKLQRIKKWIFLRFNLESLSNALLHRRVAKVPWYYGDGAALFFLFLVLVLTGSFLALDYSPSPASAYESVVEITFRDRMGWFVRAVHYWSAGMMVIVVLLHVFRQVLLGGYLPPREGTWLMGVGLFLLIITNSFTGYTLRWDERAIYAMRIPLNILYGVPLIGEELVIFVQGGLTLGAKTLSRFYAVHVIFVPLAMISLIGMHLYLVISHGVTTVQERKEVEVETAEEQIKLHEKLKKSRVTGEEFYPSSAIRSQLYSLAVLAIVVLLALSLGPQELGPKANLSETSFPKEEWWFNWYSALAALLPPSIAPIFHWVFPLAVFALLFSLPFVDRGDNRGVWRRPLAVVTAALALIAILGLTNLRMNSPWTAWPTNELPPLPPQAQLSTSASEGRRLFTEYGCFNCHSVGKPGSKFGPDLAGIDTRLSKQELRRYILQPPESVAMPSYEGRIEPGHLDRLADFVLVVQTFPTEYEQGAVK